MKHTGIGVNADGSWRQTQKSDGLIGWAYASYLVPYVPPGPNEPPPDANAGDWYQVTGARLTVREGPGATYPANGYIVKDEAVQAIRVSDDKAWIRFRRVDGFTAWADVASLKNLGSSPASAMQKLFTGVTYYSQERSEPRRVISHTLAIDLRTEGLRFLVTPPLRETLPPLCTRTTSQFLSEQDMQIAINGDGFYYLDPGQYPAEKDCQGSGDPIRLIGFAASRGKIYSQGTPGHPILYINQRNEISFDKPTGKIYNAISGDILLAGVTGRREIGGLRQRGGGETQQECQDGWPDGQTG